MTVHLPSPGSEQNNVPGTPEWDLRTPTEGKPDAPALPQRVEHVRSFKSCPQRRNISDRLKCANLLGKIKTKHKKEVEKQVMIVGVHEPTIFGVPDPDIPKCMSRSRFQEVYGEDVLVATLVAQIGIISAIRLRHEYGEYFAFSLEALQTEEFAGFLRKELDWQTISGHLEKEGLAMENYCQRKTFGLLRYEIKTYATRNAISHLGIKKLINESHWSEFALQTQRDLKFLHHAFRGPEPEHQIPLRETIKNLQRKYLEIVYWEDDSTVGFTLTERAIRMTDELGRHIAATREGSLAECI
ncbi:hypothetical protein FN846DRAFT_894640 [Sphaerosporella brunnea]|uniref:Uncharacterized protein n=1 Tax=Sphaerosporella brunnea TaxID=1250544 RepID=A0A5J5EGU3_9PEZI|nr:hypothetical protein FN846DRAFT_894640 [Sphaerosporella brunnea]